MIPAVEGLLPEPHNRRLLKLLHRLAEWHALAKLRMHTEHTLQYLERATTAIGHELRQFCKSTKEAFKCTELPSETAARARRKLKRQQGASAKHQELNASTSAKATESPPTPPKVKTFNLFTYKFHALGDYVWTIRLFGTTDSYSTQIVCSSHLLLSLMFESFL